MGRDKRKLRKIKKERDRAQARSPEHMAKAAARWPMRRCLISREWRNPLNLAQILILRGQAESARCLMAVFLVDTACLGIKNGFTRTCTEAQFNGMREAIEQDDPLIDCAPALAAKVLHESKAYALELGFEPESDAAKALPILNDVDVSECAESIPLGGPRGKPYYVAGPSDNHAKITTELTLALGPDGFDYMIHEN